MKWFLNFIFYKLVYLYTNGATQTSFLMDEDEFKLVKKSLLIMYCILPFVVLIGPNFVVVSAIVLNIAFFITYVKEPLGINILMELLWTVWTVSGAVIYAIALVLKIYSVAFIINLTLIQWISFAIMAAMPLLFMIAMSTCILFNMFVFSYYKEYPGSVILDRRLNTEECARAEEEKIPILFKTENTNRLYLNGISIVVFKTAEEAIHWRLVNA